MKKCKFIYRPTMVYLYICDSVDDIESSDVDFYAESDINGTGTIEYEIKKNDKTIFKHTIPIDDEEDEDFHQIFEDFDLSDIEGKILVREIQLYSSQTIDCEIEDGEMYPTFIYFGLASSFDGVYFEDDMDELEEYEPRSGETPEQFFKYYKIKNGKLEPFEY